LISINIDDRLLRSFLHNLETAVPTIVADKTGNFIRERARENVLPVKWRGNLHKSIVKSPASGGKCRVEATESYAWRFEEKYKGFEKQSPLLLEWARDKGGSSLVRKTIRQGGLNVDYSRKGSATEFMSKASRLFDERQATIYVEDAIKEVK